MFQRVDIKNRKQPSRQYVQNMLQRVFSNQLIIKKRVFSRKNSKLTMRK